MRNIFRTPTAKELAVRELAEAERELLTAERAVEQWTSKRSALKQAIERLKKVVQDDSGNT